MKSLIRIAIFAAAVLIGQSFALAQEKEKPFVGVGAQFARTSAAYEGGANVVSVYVEAGAPLPLNLEMRVLGSYGFRPELPTIFTRDNNPTREAYAEFRVRPELRFNFVNSGFFRPFVAGGIDYYRQRFEEYPETPAPLPGPVPAYVEQDERNLPASGLNPTLAFGVGLGEYNEASFTRLFTDNTILNASKLDGYRVNYTYTKELSERWSLKVAAEADYVTFRESSGFGPGDADDYRERDFVYRIRAGFVLK